MPDDFVRPDQRSSAFPALQIAPGKKAAALALVAAVFLGVASAPAQAQEGLDVRVGTTLTHGFSVRTADIDESKRSPNNDDGNFNYRQGSLVSNTSKFNTEIDIRGQSGGFFTRLQGFADWTNRNGAGARTQISEAAQSEIGDGFKVLDLYLDLEFAVGDAPGSLRVGNHVLNWGESTFTPGGVNVVNPYDLTRLRKPGAELRDGLLPVPMVSGQVDVTPNLSLEGFVQARWEPTSVDPSGSYFSSTDYVGRGARLAYITLPGVGLDDQEGIVGPAAFQPLIQSFRPLNLAFDRPDIRETLSVSRLPDKEAGNGGQAGLALRYYAEALNNTEFGLYAINYNSRLPNIEAQHGSLEGVQRGFLAARSVMTATDQAACSGALQQLVAMGVPGVTATTPCQALALAPAIAAARPVAARSLHSAAVTAAIDRYAETTRFRITYPEDLQTLGASFNTPLGRSGWVLQGEYSYHPDRPLQRSEAALFAEGLAPLIGVTGSGGGAAAGGIQGALTDDLLRGLPICPTPAATDCHQLASLLAFTPSATDGARLLADGSALAALNPVFANFGGVIPGYIERDVSQLQATAVRIFGPTLGAESLVFLTEAALHHVHSLPDQGVTANRLDTPGSHDQGATSTSWGYRLLSRLNYANAVGPATLSPYLQFQHDVSGYSPLPAGPFEKGRRGLTLGVGVNYLERFQADLSHTSYHGSTHSLSDRDFAQLSLSVSF